ncbi:nucleotide sugar dehydrogenase [Lentzea nigeriaca]|uniref:nucleotide sugar dehydrogenase n=1 Tax=Lentzea nigeriaca TaxID=1128665 RepID=UPI00195BCBEA|nr:nucleotide sugar dehydrogenase [Lentzea nigeriaca]MBM7859162.1 UDP-N-acetyl-D-mannosaminuronic acid dehydrogenase/UDP-N-acetyl-D-glucosamine dehydrogenase [Lentzea nigeriaca]
MTAVCGQDRLVVIGQGYVGLLIAMRAVETGFSVVGIDLDAGRVSSLREARSYVTDVSDGDLAAALESGRYLPSQSYADAQGFDAAIIAVQTPLTHGTPDLSFVESAAASIAPHIRRGALVVLESTTFPGTTEELLVPLLEEGSRLVAGEDFAVGYSPERIDPGNTRWTLANTPKVISGVNRSSLRAVDALYSRLVSTTVAVSSTKEAEFAKLLENTFRHVNIALVNEIAMFARLLDVDVWKAIDAASTKPFGYMRFTPGPGVGGHCLPVDPAYLAWRVRNELQRRFRFVELANEINETMPDYVVKRICAALSRRGKALADSVVLLLGIAYKANTGDVRGSPALRIAELLVTLGARIEVVDSHVEPHRCPSGVKPIELSEDALKLADIVVLLADHDDVDYLLVERAAGCVLDTRHRLTAAHVEYL